MRMPAKVRDILALVDGIAPFADAEEWDNVGLLAGNPDAPVERVLCALDLTEEALDEAMSRDAQLIVTHHPILFRDRKNLCETDAEGRLLCRLVRANIAMIAAHTNYDFACPGVNDALASAVGLRKNVVVERILRVGVPEEGTLAGFAARVERALGGPLRVYGNADAELRRVAVVGGSGGDYVEIAREAGADALLTGEISYHRATDAAANGLCVLEAGHAATELPGICALAKGLQIAADAVEYNIRVFDSQARLFL